ncbi:uncharacterized protein LOC132754355 [Ruditapes philippinarum]|uniref:uncharacterized protein LOC132754355 n=1 Tax=Ruditapes philippinarum TaxID=129788 RepID=UPI00295AD875|nr:uncharacterized protein LOC132754355 [Ruditapes philippinarum]
MDINKEINKRLDINGYGVEARKTSKITQLIGECLTERFLNKALTSGGKPEGSDLIKSDSDVMEVVKEFTVIEDERRGSINLDLIHLVQSKPVYIVRKGCSSGYCKLKIDTYAILMLKRIGITRFFNEVKISKLIKNVNNVYFLSSKLFFKKIRPLGYFPESPNKAIFTCNGPAMTCGKLDTVKCLEINQWPVEAITWRTRKRNNNWPSKMTLDSLEENVSCYVVPIGSKSSTDEDMEWRISFTVIERHLIWSMNDTQFKCFVLLKALNKQYLKDIVTKQNIISSYHIKNVALWLCEESPETDWKSELLVHRVQDGLLKLAGYVEKGILPHYIVPENNLFLHKSNNEKTEAKTLIDDILNNINIRINSLKKLRYKYQERLLIRCRNNDIMCEKYTSLEQFYSLTEYFRRYSIVPMLVTFPKSLNQSLAEPTCQSKERKFGKDGEDISPCIRLAFTTTDVRKRPRRTKQDIDCYISKILKLKEFDYLTVPLTCAITYFKYERFSDLRSILLPKLQDESDKYYITRYSLWPCLSICLKSGELEDFLPNIRYCDPSTNRQNIVLNFPFYWDDRGSIPYPLQLQLKKHKKSPNTATMRECLKAPLMSLYMNGLSK